MNPHFRIAALSAAALCAAASAAPPSALPVKARLEADSLLHFAGEPLRVRFSLLNPTDAPVELRLAGGKPAEAGAAATLSDWHIFNAENAQGVWIGLPQGQRLELSTGALDHADGPAHLVLGARTAITREVDLAKYFPRLKTPGTYELVWRPCGGAIGSNALKLRVAVRKEVVLKTDAGDIVLELRYDKAPATCLHFVSLAERGHFDGLVFHRVGKGVLIQGGGQEPDGRVREAPTIAAEFNDIPFAAGTVAMARRPDPEEGESRAPRKEFADSAAAQFFICLTRVADWDGRYTAFARVRQGLETAGSISEGVLTPKSDRPREPIVIRKATVREVKKD